MPWKGGGGRTYALCVTSAVLTFFTTPVPSTRRSGGMTQDYNTTVLMRSDCGYEELYEEFQSLPPVNMETPLKRREDLSLR